MSLDEVMKELRVEYIASIESKFSMFRELAKLRRAEDLQDEFHKLKGTGSTYGIKDISTLGELVESLFIKSPRSGLSELENILLLLERIIQHHRSGSSFSLEEQPECLRLRELLKSDG
jgi:HPt (histidine-containing phosphotransfer) domain-containing protein